MSKRRILIVDDIPDNIKVLQTILTVDDYHIEYALNGNDAINLCGAKSFDLILLDVMMPEMDGYEVCTYLKSKEKTKDIPIIFLTARVDQEGIIEGFKVGGQDYVTKPFNQIELLARVKTHIGLKVNNEALKMMNMQLEERVAARTIELQDRSDELENVNSKLAFLENAKNDFLSMMATELRDPLNGIVGFADMLEFSIKNKTNLKYVRYIKEASQKLIGVSDIAMLLSALRFDRYMMNVSKVNLASLINSSISKLYSQVSDKKIKFILNIDENIEIDCDDRLMGLSIEKVIENSLIHAPSKSNITIQAKLKASRLILEIKDEGIPYSEQEVSYTFKSYSKEDTTRNKEFKRFSPSLVVVKLILELHNANVLVDNDSEGRALVRFILPVE